MTIAFWCVFVAALLPYVAFAFVQGLDPSLPRANVRALSGRSARAHAAHLNAFEAFPPFAAAVVISHLSLGDNRTSNLLALAFVGVRAAHLAFYLADRQPPRSAAFGLGVIIVIAMFLHAAWG
ncbi:MAG: MAPEG family protein [Pseudomonadota bacterium]|nr:MAPEG family protein [Pseudomonadota bacterium]